MSEFSIGWMTYNPLGACQIPVDDGATLYALDVKKFSGDDIRLLLGDYTTYSPELKKKFDTFIDNLTNFFG